MRSIAAGVINTGGNENQGVDRKMGYIYWSTCDVVQILHFVG
jgi:hypothetical protein